jgi:hypothetical protein
MPPRAVIIGSAHYDDNGIDDFDTIERSAPAIQRLFSGSDLWEKCHLVLDPKRPHEICDAITEAAEGCGDETLLVYFIGHAHFWQDSEPKDLYLGLRTSRQDQEWSYLGARYVYNAIRNSQAISKVLILDCCYSGYVSGLSTDFTSLRPLPEWMYLARMHGTCVLTATSPDRKAEWGLRRMLL